MAVTIAQPIPMSQAERDLAIRTVLSEAGGQGPQGMAAVAHVIRNRVISGKYGGGSYEIGRAHV